MAHLSIFLLGPYHITNEDQKPVHFEYDKVRALLAYLAVESDRPLRREFLAGLLWPEQPESAALNSLRQAIMKLRQAVGDAVTEPPILNISRDSIQINPLSGFTVDVREFAALLETTRRHRHRNPHTCLSCAENRKQAVRLYRGDFLDQLSLDDCPEFESWIVIQREQLRILILQALASITDFHLLRQEYDTAQYYASRQIEIDSLQERAYQQMMTALAMDDRRTEALKCFEACRRLLKKELEVEPEEESEKLYRLIKAGLFKDHYQGVKAYSSGLPSPPSPFFGRGKELAKISRLLENPEVRLITLIGPGGVGKSSLALKTAIDHEKMFTHGACFVPLSQIGSAEEIYRSIAANLNLSFLGNLDYKTQLSNYLSDKEILIILDNFEHLLPAGTEKINALLSAARQVVIILTTTVRIHSSDEYILPILGLDFPNSDTHGNNEAYNAVDLFIHCILQNGGTVQEPDLLWIHQICRLLEGNPLAIIMAASLTRTLSCSDVAKAIEDGIDLLTTSRNDIPERQKSVRSLYDYAWNQLTEIEQRQIRRLSVFRGGFQRESAYKVAEASLVDLTDFIDRSFVLKKQSDRYQIHRLLQQYSYEKLAEANEVSLALERHLEYYVEFAEQAESQLFQARQKDWLKLLDLEQGNLHVAFHTAQAGGAAFAEPALRLAGALGRYWEQRGHWREGLDWLNAALSMGGKNASIPADLIVKVLFWAGILASYLGQNNKVDELTRIGLALCKPDSPRNRALMLTLLGGLRRTEGDYTSAQTLFQECLELFKKAGDRWGICVALNNLFRIHYRRNEYQKATSLALQSLSLAKEDSDQWNIALAQDFLGIVAHDQGKYDQAKAYLSDSLDISRSIGAGFMIGHAIYWLGRVARSQCDPDFATLLFEQSLAHYREISGKWGIAVSLLGLGTTAFDVKDYLRAEKLLQESLTVMQEVGDTQLLAYVQIRIADVAGVMQQSKRAVSLYRESLSSLVTIEDRWLIALAIAGLAGVATRQHEYNRAAILFGIEAGIRKLIGTPRSPAERAVVKQSFCILRAQLSASEMHRSRGEGMRIAKSALANVIEYVLDYFPHA